MFFFFGGGDADKKVNVFRMIKGQGHGFFLSRSELWNEIKNF